MNRRGGATLRKLSFIFWMMTILVVVSFFYNDLVKLPNSSLFIEENESDTKSSTKETKQENDPKMDVPEQGLHTYIGLDQEEIQSKIGEPDRIDPSLYGYDWWVYPIDKQNYMQIGIEEGKVITVFGIGNELETEPFKVGRSSAEIFQKYPPNSNVSLNYNDGSYRFELSEEEMLLRPLVKIGETWVQLYFDSFTQKLSSIRYLTPELLIIQRPYALEYRGELPEDPVLNREDWAKIEEGEQSQILDITNVIRNRHDVASVDWHEEAAEVAFNHSKEMQEENYFSHTSPVSGDLSERLSKGGVDFTQAGENIAANYIDGIAAVEGWLNSKGHRDTMLNENYTHLGVGIYQKHYTQNFIVPLEIE
jgi:uncharacterized protein YkwD